MAVGLAMQMVRIGLGTAVFLIAKLFDRMELAVLIFPILVIAAAAGYAFSIKKTNWIALDHRGTLTVELCRVE